MLTSSFPVSIKSYRKLPCEASNFRRPVIYITAFEQFLFQITDIIDKTQWNVLIGFGKSHGFAYLAYTRLFSDWLINHYLELCSPLLGLLVIDTKLISLYNLFFIPRKQSYWLIVWYEIGGSFSCVFTKTRTAVFNVIFLLLVFWLDHNFFLFCFPYSVVLNCPSKIGLLFSYLNSFAVFFFCDFIFYWP